MFNVIFSRKSELKIEKFILSYKNNFLSLFSDTWIYNEEIIIQNYINLSNNFHKEILDKIENYLSNSQVYWYKVINQRLKWIYIKIKSFLIFVEYEEKRRSKIRIVKNIIFNKK